MHSATVRTRLSCHSLGAFFAAFVFGAAQTGAVTISVDATADDTTANGNCTLREAVIAANTDTAVDDCDAGSGADVIDVPAGNYVLSLSGAGEDAAATGDLDILEDVDISGAGLGSTTIDGNASDRVFHVDPGNAGLTVSIAGVTVTNGGAVPDGGGILANGSLTIQNSLITDNHATPTVPQLPRFGGGVLSTGSLEILSSTISFNTIGGFFAGTISGPSLGGGGIGALGTLTIDGSTIEGNDARYDRAGGGGAFSLGSANISNSTFNDNTAVSGDVVTPFDAGGGYIAFGPAVVSNSTFSGNSASTLFCCIVRGGGLAAAAAVTLNNVTITENSAPDGGGVAVDPFEMVTARNTIVANNSAQTATDNCNNPSSITGNAYNLASDTSCGFSGTDLVGVDPTLSPLQNNGGPTLTHALFTGSPAIDAANPAIPGSGGSACEATDQRGVTRPDGPRCDIGAFEGEIPAPPMLDHYKCYQGRDLKNPKFTQRTDETTDQIVASQDVESKKLKFVCSPVDKNGEGINSPGTHLACYQIKADNLVPRPSVEVSTQFQVSRFELKKAKLLCLPATKTILP